MLVLQLIKYLPRSLTVCVSKKTHFITLTLLVVGRFVVQGSVFCISRVTQFLSGTSTQPQLSRTGSLCLEEGVSCIGRSIAYGKHDNFLVCKPVSVRTGSLCLAGRASC